MTPERTGHMHRTIALLARTELDVDCMTQAAAEIPGVTLTVLPNETDREREIAATIFGLHGEKHEFIFENWKFTAQQVQEAGGHIVNLVVDGRGLPSGPDPKPFYDRVEQLKSDEAERQS